MSPAASDSHYLARMDPLISGMTNVYWSVSGRDTDYEMIQNLELRTGCGHALGEVSTPESRENVAYTILVKFLERCLNSRGVCGLAANHANSFAERFLSPVFSDRRQVIIRDDVLRDHAIMVGLLPRPARVVPGWLAEVVPVVASYCTCQRPVLGLDFQDVCEVCGKEVPPF